MPIDKQSFDKAWDANKTATVAVTFAIGLIAIDKLVKDGKHEEAFSLIAEGADTENIWLAEVKTNADRARAFREGTERNSPERTQENGKGGATGTGE